MSFASRLKAAVVEPNKVQLYWLGQAGFAIKTATGKILFIDPYFTDSVYQSFCEENGYAFKRLSAPLLDADDLASDEIYISHEHGDHLDVEAFPQACAEECTRIICNDESSKILKELGVETSKIEEVQVGDYIQGEGYSVRILRANHGDLCPNAMGFLFDFGTVRIYYSGDTCFDEQLAKEVSAYAPDVCLLPVNGAFGNLNHEEAVKFAKIIKGKVLIPYHFWTFPLHLGEPLELIHMFEKDEQGLQLQLLMPGEPYLF